MTGMHEHNAAPLPDALASTSRDLGLELLGLRVNGAELGKMLGVSRQAVSKAVARGTIGRPGPDGRFDARRAVREWMANSDPGRVRAQALKPGADAIAKLREQAQTLAAEVDALRDELTIEHEWGDAREQAAGFRAQEAASRQLARFTDALLAQWAEGCAAASAGRLARWLDELAAVEFYGIDLAEFRRDFPENEGEEAGDSGAA